MKLINKLLMGAVAAVAMCNTGCSDGTPEYSYHPSKDVDFNYCVDGDEYALDYYVVSRVKFNNTSSKTGNVVWDFGDGSTSTENNPVHKFAKAGVYRVTLTVDGVGYQTYPILIYDIKPTLSVAEQSTEVIEFGNTTMSFNLELPNPENLKVRYEWRFPEGTTYADGTPVTTFTGYADAQGNIQYPQAVKFKNIGSQKIEISTWFDVDGENRRLEDTYLNVQVGCNEPAPTLYYAQRNGNIKALKLVDTDKLPAGTKVFPYDMGVNAGSNTFNLVYADVAGEGWVYILDAGKQYYYINDENGNLGDGYINCMRPDGTGVNTVITNVGGPAFCDPYCGFASGEYLYYTDRNTGFSRVLLSARGEVQSKELSGSTWLRGEYFCKNELLPFYGRGIAYGAISTGLYKDKKGVWWWPKNYNGNSIVRFKDTDIYKTAKEAEAAGIKGVPYPVIMSGIKVRAFALDEARGSMYLWKLSGVPGFYHYATPSDTETGDENKPLASVAMDADPINTTADEGVSTCQLALHQETGRVYFAWRPTATDGSKIPAGIVYYDPATKKMTRYSESTDLATGICINPNKTKLF